MQDRAARLPGVLVMLLGLLMACSAPAPASGSAGSAPSGDARPAPAAAAAAAPAASSAATPSGRPLPPRPDHGVEKVVVGVLGTTADVPFYLAEEAGYLEHMRVEPQFERFDSGGRMVASLATNQIEIGGGSPSVGLYNAIARGVDVKLVGDRAAGRPGYSVFIRKDLAESGALRDYADLRGKRIAVAARGTTAEVVAGRMLEKGGLTLADAEIVEMPYPDMTLAIASGQIDVGIAPEPNGSIAVQRGGAVMWHKGSEIVPNQASSVIMYTAQFMETRPQAACDFMIAYLLGVRDYNDAFERKDPAALARARDTILRRTDLRDPDLLERMEPSYINPDGMFDRDALAADYEWFRQYGGLTETVDLNAITDDNYANYAVSVLGPYR
jgi:NitT/TauT family transport system substrate-binding protein